MGSYQGAVAGASLRAARRKFVLEIAKRVKSSNHLAMCFSFIAAENPKDGPATEKILYTLFQNTTFFFHLRKYDAFCFQSKTLRNCLQCTQNK